MEDPRLRELSKDLIPSNIVHSHMDNIGGLERKYKNGLTRKIDIPKKLVTIIDADGNELYSNILDDNHPLIKCATIYYNWDNRKIGRRYKYVSVQAFKRAQNFVREQIEAIEDIYRVV